MPIRIRLEMREDVEMDGLGTGEEAPRRTYIKKKFYERYGYTEGCEGCNRARAGLTQRGHDERCRDRMEKEEKDEEGQRLLNGARSRGEAFIEEKIRKADEGRKADEDRKAEENAKRERENGKERDIHVPLEN